MATQIGIFDRPAPRDEYCPCCGTQIRVWKKAIISTAVASLVRLVALYRGEPLHHDDFTVLLKDRNFSQLKLWGLITPAVNDDPMKRSSGRWSPTLRGVSFVRGEIKIEKYAVTKHNTLWRLDGPMVGIREALGSRFDYRELLRVQEVAA